MLWVIGIAVLLVFLVIVAGVIAVVWSVVSADEEGGDNLVSVRIESGDPNTNLDHDSSDFDGDWKVLREEISLSGLEALIEQPRKAFLSLVESGEEPRKALKSLQLPKYKGQTVLRKQSFEECDKVIDLFNSDLRFDSPDLKSYLAATKKIPIRDMWRAAWFLEKYVKDKTHHVEYKHYDSKRMYMIFSKAGLAEKASKLDVKEKLQVVKMGRLSEVYKEAFKTSKGSRKRENLVERLAESEEALALLRDELDDLNFLVINLPEAINWLEVNKARARARVIAEFVYQMDLAAA